MADTPTTADMYRALDAADGHVRLANALSGASGPILGAVRALAAAFDTPEECRAAASALRRWAAWPLPLRLRRAMRAAADAFEATADAVWGPAPFPREILDNPTGDFDFRT